MMTLGKMNRLQISRIGAYDTYLDGGDHGEVLLIEETRGVERSMGDELSVFVYLDIDDTLMATTTKPYVLAGECASLQVVSLTDNGAYLEWGLKSDLFVPRSEQLGDMAIGNRCVAYAMVDKTNQRMIASTRLYNHLEDENQGVFKAGEEVALLVCQKTDLGFKAVVNGSHLGLLYSNEIFSDLNVGDSSVGYIKALREDKKIDLILQKIGGEARTELEAVILEHLQQIGGESTLTDKSPPEAIYKTFGVSKKAYKNAIGGLFRSRLILLSKEKISLVRSAGIVSEKADVKKSPWDK